MVTTNMCQVCIGNQVQRGFAATGKGRLPTPVLTPATITAAALVRADGGAFLIDARQG
jgi:hypothetical protein